MYSILVLHGPNLNLLGRREPALYGQQTLAQIDEDLRAEGKALNLEVVCRQSNHEGEMLDILHDCMAWAAGVVLNAAGYTHTSVALRDAVVAIGFPVVEVHLTNIHGREPFRQHSMLAAVCAGSITGFGINSYRLGLQALAWRLQEK